jgi:hypothetical protein
MFTVSTSKNTGSFWARNKPFIDNLFKAGAIIVGLKVLKFAVDKYDL